MGRSEEVKTEFWEKLEDEAVGVSISDGLILTYLLTWIIGVVLKQLRLLHGQVEDSTTLVNSLSPQMSQLVKDAVAS